MTDDIRHPDDRNQNQRISDLEEGIKGLNIFVLIIKIGNKLKEIYGKVCNRGRQRVIDDVIIRDNDGNRYKRKDKSQ